MIKTLLMHTHFSRQIFRISMFALTLLSLQVQAQDRDISGTVVSEDGETLPGVTIQVDGTTIGTITDLDGKFNLSVPDDAILIFSFIGFEQQSIPVNDQTQFNVTLVESSTLIDEVVVVGYGTQKKSHLTGAISKVTNENLDQIPLSRADDALIGQIAGVNIQATDGTVGGAPTIRIRGVGSITASSGPLLVIDGTVVTSDFFGSVDMNDVESFEVLKDAASAAIYGARGANGVIIITTKQGTEGKTKFSYNSFIGMQDVKTNPDYNTSVAEGVVAEMALNGELSDRSTYKERIGVDNNWQDIIFDGGTIASHSLGARGGTKKTKFSAALTYVHDEGVLLTDDLKKYNVKARVDTEVNDRFTTGFSINPSYTIRRRFDGSTHDILRQAPWLPLYLDENSIQYVNRLRDGGKYKDAKVGDYAVQRMFDDYDLVAGIPIESGGTDVSNTSNTNPGAKVLERDRRDYKFKMFGKVYLKYKITDGLSLYGSISGDYQDTQRKRWQGSLAHRSGAAESRSIYENYNQLHTVMDAYLSYDKTINLHEINAIVGSSSERWKVRETAATGIGYDFDYIETLNAASTILEATSYETEKRYLSFFGRFNYSYNSKYLASVSLRSDGSSVFGSKRKYGFFPAFSLGWRISEEGFLSNSDVISNLKLRVSYGATGNDLIETNDDLVNWYAYQALLAQTSAVVNGVVATGFNPSNIANELLSWEKSVEFNPAIDFGLFGGAITGSVDYYKRTSTGLLLDLQVSSVTGFNSALVNRGEVTNEGVEIEVRTHNVSKPNFSWETTFIASRNVNTLTDFADSDGLITSVDSKRAAEWINNVGSPISSFYGYVVDREIPLEYIKDAFHPIGAEAQDVYVKDLNGDGIIDAEDKTELGSPYPDFIWSVTNSFKVKNFDLSFMFQGSHGAEVRNMADQYLYNHFNSSQDFDQATTPDQEFIQQKIFTNSIVQDASYVSLRNINIGYTLPKTLLNKVGLTGLRLYLSTQNLLYLKSSNYTGFNPEGIDDTSPINYGYQRGGSPIARKYVFGINLNF